MKRGFIVAIGGAAIVVAGLAGCGGDDKKDDASTTAGAATASETSAAGTAAGTAKVTIDGQDQNVTGAVACTTAAGKVTIAVGDATQAIGAVLTEGDPLTVDSVGLGNVGGAALGYTAGAPGGEATATKDGNTYTIAGKVTGVDLANPTAQVTKTFEMEVACP